MKFIFISIFIIKIQSSNTTESCKNLLEYKKYHPIFSTEKIWEYCNEVWKTVIKSDNFKNSFNSPDSYTKFTRKAFKLQKRFFNTISDHLNIQKIGYDNTLKYTDDDINFIDSFTKSSVDMLESINECTYLKIGNMNLDEYKEILLDTIKHRFICENNEKRLPRFRFIPCEQLEFVKKFKCGMTNLQNYTAEFSTRPQNENTMFALFGTDISYNIFYWFLFAMFCIVVLVFLNCYQEYYFISKKKKLRREIPEFDVADDTVIGKEYRFIDIE